MDGTMRFAFSPGTLFHGPGCVAELGAELDALGCRRALVVTGRTVGTVDAVMDPIERGLGDRHVGTVAETTAAKTLGSAALAAERARSLDADVLVGVGGGSSLDVTALTATLMAHEGDPTAVADEMVERGSISIPADRSVLPIVCVPTTLPGADLTQVAGIGLSMDTAETDPAAVPGGGISDERLLPTVSVYDADLVATTPPELLVRSAMNGYDKGIEMLYARAQTPVTDAVAMRGLSLLHGWLPELAERDVAVVDRVLEGVSLVQYGISTPDAYRASIIHAFGHALTATYPIQQGVAHAIAAPHVLAYVFSQVDGRRELLVEALGVAAASEPAPAIVREVEATRDALGLPSALRSVEGATQDDWSDLADLVLGDSFMAATPAGLDATHGEIEGVFEAMW